MIQGQVWAAVVLAVLITGAPPTGRPTLQAGLEG